MNTCNIPIKEKCLPQGVDGSIKFEILNATVDPLGYSARIGTTDINVTANVDGDDVLIAIPLVNLGFEVGKYTGYFVTNTKTEGLFFQFNIVLNITNNVTI